MIADSYTQDLDEGETTLLGDYIILNVLALFIHSDTLTEASSGGSADQWKAGPQYGTEEERLA